ncbi:MAG: P-loop NTPase [Chloroflexi bacterium]|nr:P-loop NTPase [Chloroflexota bacterium]
MKISISGKGGTGKSMLTTLLSVVLAEKGYKVLTVDSDDSNPGLYRMLGYDEAPRPLMDLFGGEKEVVAEIKRRTTGEEKQSRSEWMTKDSFHIDDIPARYTLGKNGQKLISIGKITTAFEGCACPMAEVLKLFLQKISLGEKDIVIVDMEARVRCEEYLGRAQ